MCRQEYKFWEQKNALSAALCETRTKGRLIHHIDHGTWFNPWMASITWIFIWSQNLKKKKALGTQSCGFGKSQLFLNISTDRLSPVGAERNILACSSAVRPLGIRASLPGSSKEVVFYAELWRWKAAELPNGFSCFTWGEECHGDRKWSLWVDRHKVLCSPACSSGRCLGTALDHSFLNFFFNVQWCLEMEMGTYEWEIHKYSHPSIYLNDRRK